MTNKQILAVCLIYERKLHELDETEEWKRNSTLIDANPRLYHVLTMIPRLRQLVLEHRIEKAFRWLGFIQGVLWTEGIYTIDELKKHNMPEGAEFDAKA